MELRTGEKACLTFHVMGTFRIKVLMYSTSPMRASIIIHKDEVICCCHRSDYWHHLVKVVSIVEVVINQVVRPESIWILGQPAHWTLIP